MAKLFGEKVLENNDIFIYVPDKKEIVRIAGGTGDNLLPEDREQGYVDYIYYEQYAILDEFVEVDGGQVMLKAYIQDKYPQLEACIPDVLDMSYDNPDMNYILLI